MAKYYVNTNTQDNGGHDVHEDGCEWLPAEENRKYLGEFDNCFEAVQEARAYYPATADGCEHCSPDCHLRSKPAEKIEQQVSESADTSD